MSLRKLLAALMVVSLVLGLVGTAAFAQGDEALYNEAVQMLKAFKIVEGDAGTGEMRPQDPITRAELMKILAVAAGQADNAELLMNVPSPFSDVESGVWYTGYVAVAKAKGWTTGYPDGTFRPKANVTNAEVIAFLARVTGLQPAAGAWPTNYITAAVNAGLIPEGVDVAALANAPAIRGAVFVMSHNAFLKVRDDSGKNLYQKSFDNTAPTVTLNKVDATTTAAKVTVSGKVEGDAVAALVNGTPVVLAADGTFTAEVELQVGANQISVVAVDAVGNEGKASVSVERQNTPAAAIEAPATLEVEVGQTATAAVVVKDTNGAAIPGATFAAKVEPAELGTFDVATGTFTAGTKAGTGTLTLSAGEVSATVALTVKPGALAKLIVTPSKSYAAPGDLVTFDVKGEDAHGNAVTVSGATFSIEGADALINPSNGNFIASKAGNYTITAKVGEITGSATVGVHGDIAKVVLSAPETIVANGTTKVEIKAAVQDENGNVVSNYDGLVEITNALTSGLDFDDPTVEAVNGVATFKATADTSQAGAILTIKARADVNGDDDTADDADEDTEGKLSIEAVEQVATSVELKADQKYLRANDGDTTATFTITVKDQAGVEMEDGAWDYDWTVTGAAVEAESDDDSGTGLYTAGETNKLTVESIKGETGKVTATVTIEGIGSATAEMTAAVAGDPAKLQLEVSGEAPANSAADQDTDNSVKVTITVTDKNGVPVPFGAIGSAKTVTVGFDSTTDVDVEDDDGVSLLPFSAKKTVSVSFEGEDSKAIWFTSENARTYTLTAKDSAGDLTSATATATIVPNDPAQFAFTDGVSLPAEWQLLLSNPKATFTVQLQDQFGNQVKKAGVKVKLEGRDGATVTDEITINGKKETNTLETDANGEVKVEVETLPYNTRDYRLAIVNGGDHGPAADDFEVAFELRAIVATSIKAEFVQVADPEIAVNTTTAGTPILLKVTVTDPHGVGVDALDLDLFTLELGDEEWSDDADFVAEPDDFWVGSMLTDNSDGTYTIELYPAKADRLTATVKLAVGAGLQASDTVRVKAGAPYAPIIAEAEATATDAGEISLDKNTIKAFTLRLADQWGNMTTADTTYYVTVDLDGAPNTSVRLSTTGANVVDKGSGSGIDANTKLSDLIKVRAGTTIYLLVNDDSVPQTVVFIGAENSDDTPDVGGDQVINVPSDTALPSEYTLTINP